MLAFFGNISLCIALFFSIMQSIPPLIGFWRNNPYFLACARPSAWGQFVFIVIAYALLTSAFVFNDFSIAYVAANSHATLPLMYKLTAAWGAHEGSILLWILILNIWTITFSILQKDNPTLALVLAMLGLTSLCFLCFLLLTSNPFVAAPEFASGNDLNPLLQDAGFIIHPPMLYTGYVGFSVAFAITLAALIYGKLDQTWAFVTRRFAIAAWIFLTFGITLGSWWAYRVLGWGGYWFWDPVENASLLPWIAGTALIHVLILADKRNMAKAWAALIAIVCFALSLLGTFLVRSGVLVSAHTFANDPARGVLLLGLLTIVLTAALALYIARLPILEKSEPQTFSFLSRESSLLLNSGLLFIAMLTVLLGTLYPLLVDALQLGSISVGAPYFNKVMLPIVFITLAIMGCAPLCNWQSQSVNRFIIQSIKRFGLSCLTASVLLWGVTGQFDLTALISLILSFWIIFSVANSWRILPGMTLAHAGFAILIIGIMLSSILNQERNVRMKPGDTIDVGPYQFLYIDSRGINGANYRGIQAAFEVTKNANHITNLYPEKRIYTVRDMVMTKVDINPSLFRDLYIALGEPLDEQTWSVRLYYKPFVRWIWFGGLIMMLGGLLTLLQKRSGKYA